MNPMARRALWPLIERWYVWLVVWVAVAIPMSWAGLNTGLIVAVASIVTVCAFLYYRRRKGSVLR